MSLRRLLIVIVSSLISFRTITVLIVGTMILFTASKQIINQNNKQEINLVRNLFLNNLSLLKEHSDVFKNNYTNNQGHYHFCQDELKNSNLSFYVMSNDSGTILYKKLIFTNDKAFINDLDAFIVLFFKNNSAYERQGIIILNNKPYFITITAVRKNKSVKSKSNFIIIGKEITEGLINQESHLINKRIQMGLYDDPKLSTGFKDARQELSNNKQLFIKVLNEEMTYAYTLFYDITGKPSILLRVDIPRRDYLLIRNAFIALIIAFFIIGLIYTKIVFHITDKYFFNRLKNLSLWVKEITVKKNLSARYTDIREDEFTEVANALNNLLNELETTLHQNKLTMKELDNKALELESKTQELEGKNKELENKTKELTAKNFEIETTSIKITKKDKELEAKNKELKIIDNNKHQLMNMTILDLKNPLTAIKCFSEVLCIWVKQNTEKTVDRRKTELNEITTALNDMLYELEKNIYKYDQASREVEIKARELQEKNEELRVLDNKKNELLGIAAHDLRNPLTTIKCFSEILLTGSIGNITAKQEHGIKLIHKASNDMFTIINDLLDVSVIEKGKLSLKLEKDDLTKLLVYKINSNQIIANQKNITIHYTLHPISRVVFDKNRIGQVLDNLISNAIKYSQPKSDIYVYLTQESNMAKICVEDHGPGLSDEDKKKLFGTFQKLSARPTAGEKSTGLGLAIVKKIVQAHQGTIYVESHLGIGSKFIFTVPLAIEDDDDIISYIHDDNKSNLKKAG